MLNTNYVPPEGSPSASLWLIGEAPGEIENRTGIVFSGSAGRYLDMALRDAELLRSELFIWNVFTKRPPKNDAGYFFQDKKSLYLNIEGEEMLKGLTLLIDEYKPNCIMTLGRTSTYLLTGKTTITKWRGSLLPCLFNDGIKIYPSFHPSYVMRLMQEGGSYIPGAKKKGMNVFPTFIKDLQRASYQSEFPEIREKQKTYFIPETSYDISRWFDSVKEKEIACDIETIVVPKVPPIVTRVGFANNDHNAMSIPFTRHGKLCWDINEWADILVAISKFFLSDRKFIFQNGFYDLTVLGKLFGLRVNNVLDTMVQQHCAYPHLPKGLDYQTSVYTWEPYYKQERTMPLVGFSSDEGLSRYNCKDCMVTKEIQPITMRDIINMNMKEGHDRTLSLYPSLLFMMLKGVKLNIKRKKELEILFQRKVNEAKREICKIAGRDINPKSPKQISQLLCVDLQMPMITNRKTGKITTDATALKKMKEKFPHPIFGLIETHRKFSKLCDTYAKMEIGEDSRIYTTYDPTGTVTWRLSSYESPLGSGGNLQNIPKRTKEGLEIRKLFVPDEGFSLIACDRAQAEDRYVTWKAGDIEGIQNYEAGNDPHWQNAIKLFRLDPSLKYDSSNPQHYKWRNKIAKHAKHAGNYGVGPVQLRNMLINMADFYEYEVVDCKVLLDAQRRAAPMIEAWKAWVREKIRCDRTLVTCLGRKRIFYGRITDDTFRKAYAYEPQSVIGELMCIDIRDIHHELTCEDFQPLMNVHDEVIAQVKTEKLAEYIKKIRIIMDKALKVTDIYGTERELRIPIDFKFSSKSWGELEEWKD